MLPLHVPRTARPGARLILMLIDDEQIDRRAVQEAHALRDAGYEVEFIGRRFGGPAQDSVDGFPVHRMPYVELGFNYNEALYEHLVLFPRRVTTGLYDALDKRLKGARASLVRRVEALAPPALRENAAKAVNFGLSRGFAAGMRQYRKVADWSLEGAAGYYRSISGSDRQYEFAERVFAGKLFHQYVDRGVYAVLAHDLPKLKMGAQLASLLEVPLAFDAHEAFWAQSQFTPERQRELQAIERELLPLTAFWFIVNEMLGDFLVEHHREHGAAVPRPAVVYNSVPYWPGLEASRPQDLLRKKTGIGAETRIALYQGGLSERRNLDAIVHAAAQLNDGRWAFVFMGDGPEKPRLKALAASLGAPVHFIDAVSQDVLLAHTCSADLGLIPYQAVDVNTRFASPNKLYEYVQAGLPILANEIPYVSWVFERHAIGTQADFGSAESLAGAIRAMSGDKLAALREGLAAERRRLSWEADAVKVVAAFDGLRAPADRVTR